MVYISIVCVGVLPAEQLPGDPVAPPPHGTRRLEAGVWLQDHLRSGPQRLKVLQGKLSGNKTYQLLSQKVREFIICMLYNRVLSLFC